MFRRLAAELANSSFGTSIPKEVAAHRSKAKSRGTMLIAVVDADTLATAERRRQLLSVPPAGPNEQIFVFIPKRNIETWIRRLNGGDANEDTSYKHSKDNGRIVDAAARFLEIVRRDIEPDLPSLVEGVREARRIPRQHGSGSR